MATVRELIEYLSQLDPDATVIMSKDGEGNYFSPWAKAHSDGLYAPDSTWAGEFFDDYSLQEEPDEYYLTGNEVRAVVLWPIN